MNIFILCIYLVLSSVGLALLRKSFSAFESFSLFQLIRSVHFWIGGLLYGSGFVIWLWMLAKNNLSYIFPVAAGGLVVATATLGVLFLHERLLPLQVVGIVLILGGILLVTLGKS